jgi:glycosyltransferase involved in cell wall biosynthesis
VKISVVTPVLNERRFIAGWYQNARKFADEILVIDTGSIDGTYEWLQAIRNEDYKLNAYRWPETYLPYQWPEHDIRNWTLKSASGDWIVMLDTDDMVDDAFIENLNELSDAKWLIGRFPYLQFWGDYGHLRARDFWPPIRYSTARNSLPIIGRHRLGILRNWFGWYPNKVPKICKRDDRISYTPTGNHCILQYKNYGRFSYYLPSVTKDSDLGVHHFHFVHFGKTAGNRNHEQNKRVRLIEYKGTIPDEVKYYRV